jgi:glycosyltransferase involved in cell wall biosynthesis
MNRINYSFIIPVFNRPEEIEKLLVSIDQLTFQKDFEVVIIEDGSDLRCQTVCSRFRESGISFMYLIPNN